MLKYGTFWLIAIAAIVGAAWYRATADAAKPPVLPSKIAFVPGGSSDYWALTVAGAEQAAKQRGVELIVREPKQDESVQQQNAILTALTSSDVDGVAVSVLDSEGQVAVINALADTAPVVTFDSDAPLSARRGYVGTSNFSAGLMAGTLVKRAIPEGGKIAVFMANASKSNMQDRQSGLKTRIEESPVPEESSVDPRYEIVGYFTDEGNDETFNDNVKKVLAEHDDIACMVGLNSRHAPLLLKALEDAGKLDSVKLITFDAAPGTLDGVEAGHIFATIAQDPYHYGYEAVNMLIDLCDQDNEYLPLVGRGAIHVSVEAITSDKVDDFRKRLQARKQQPATAKS